MIKIRGIILFFLGAGWIYLVRHDPDEGPIMIGFIGSGIGFFVFLEGLKQEIIEAIQKQNRDYDSETNTSD
ncbi:MAG: hypothetical protein JXR23_02640 [Pontiellaceae bacterium]|nr:hypothetical protein [Pontiellaceae bacterium]